MATTGMLPAPSPAAFATSERANSVCVCVCVCACACVCVCTCTHASTYVSVCVNFDIGPTAVSIYIYMHTHYLFPKLFAVIGDITLLVKLSGRHPYTYIVYHCVWSSTPSYSTGTHYLQYKVAVITILLGSLCTQPASYHGQPLKLRDGFRQAGDGCMLHACSHTSLSQMLGSLVNRTHTSINT